jgi:hypothetical protein
MIKQSKISYELTEFYAIKSDILENIEFTMKHYSHVQIDILNEELIAVNKLIAAQKLREKYPNSFCL